MTIDPSVSSAPFAAIQQESYYKPEEEILLSMHTVFRVEEIARIGKSKSLHELNLRLTADDDPELRTLTEHIRREMDGGETGWKQFGSLLIKLNQLSEAEKRYSMLLNQTSDLSDKAHFYYQLGCTKKRQGDYVKAIEYYEKTLAIEETLRLNHLSLATSYNNIGLVFANMSEHSKALSFYEKAIQIRQNTLPANHPDIKAFQKNHRKCKNEVVAFESTNKRMFFTYLK